MTVENEIYSVHLQNYKQEDPKTRSQKYLIQFNELMDKLNQQFETVVAMLNLPFEKSLMTYPSLEYVMDIIQQEDLTDKNREFFQELMKEVEIKNAIAQKVLSNRLAAVGNLEEEAEVNLQHKEYQKESFRLLRFCRKMIEKKDKEAGYIGFEQPEGVPDVEPITEKELDQQQVDPIGGDTIPPYYSREISRYEPPIPVKEKEKQEALEKVREITNEGQRRVKVRNLQKEILTYHGIMKVWNPIQNLVNSNPLEVPNHQESLRQRQKRSRLLLKYVLNVRGTMMKSIAQNSYLKKENRGLYLLNQ